MAGSAGSAESVTFLEIAAEVIDPVEWAAMMLTRVGRPGMTQVEAMEAVKEIVRKAIEIAAAQNK